MKNIDTLQELTIEELTVQSVIKLAKFIKEKDEGRPLSEIKMQLLELGFVFINDVYNHLKNCTGLYIGSKEGEPYSLHIRENPAKKGYYLNSIEKAHLLK